MTTTEFNIFCAELRHYAKKRYADTPDAECYVICAADQLQLEGIDHLPYPEVAPERWTRIDAVLDENTIFPPADPDED